MEGWEQGVYCARSRPRKEASLRLVIAEKPSVARDLARVLGASSREEGALRGDGMLITWCVGHLVTLAEPQEIQPNWKVWSFRNLPMIPEEFPLRALPGARDQWEVVRRLLLRKDVQEVVNACDAGREGELIFRHVYQLAGCQKPVMRLWISSLTDSAIREGWLKLRSGKELDPLGDAARCRAEADWLVGLNATRALTLKGREGGMGESPLYSVGRVQTPTLALLVVREQEVRAFVPESFWTVLAVFQVEQGRYPGRWCRRLPGSSPEGEGAAESPERLATEEEARVIAEKVRGRIGVVVRLEKEEQKIPPPLLFSLTSLQRTANRRFGMSAARTLEVAQILYERHKLLTYPRTDSEVLSTDQVAEFPQRISALALGPYLSFANEILARPGGPKLGRRFVNDQGVTDHHAIIPTPIRPNLEALTREERGIYDLVVRRFLGAFFPDARVERTRLWTVVEEEPFETRGSVVVEAGWRNVAGFGNEDVPQDHRGKKKKDEEEEEGGETADAGLLPAVVEGEKAQVRSVETPHQKTRPPPRYTEARLLQAMEGVGKSMEDGELRAAMKDRGLGTPATRAAIIETLLRRGYLERSKKLLLPTPQGEELIAVLPVPELKSAELTGDWEARLAQVARGELPRTRFMADTASFTTRVVEAISAATMPRIRAVTSSPSAAPPAPWRTAPRKSAGRKGGEKTETRASKTGPRPPSSLSRTPKTPRAKKESPSKVPSPSPHVPTISSPATSPLGSCPLCRQGIVIRGKKGWGCSRWREGCGFVVWERVAGKDLTHDEVARLVSSGESGVLSGFVSRTGLVFSARLRLHLNPNAGTTEVEVIPEKR